MTLTSDPSKRVRMDQMSRRILRTLAQHVQVDVAAVAKVLGATQDVVRHRLAALKEGGLLQGFEVRLDAGRLERPYEFLVSGAPTPGTDGQAIARLCMTGDVTRVFSLASAHSVAFTVVGKDAAATQRRGMALAEEAGLRQAQAVLVINTFQDRASSALADALGVGPHSAEAAAPVAAQPLVAVSDPAASVAEAMPEPVAA